MIRSWKEFKNLSESDIANINLPNKSFREHMFLKEIESDFLLDNDCHLFFNHKDYIVDISYEFDVLFILNNKKKLKNNKKIICNIEFHDYSCQSNYDDKSIRKMFDSKKKSAIEYFSNLFYDNESYWLDFYFYYKISKNKTKFLRETISLKNKNKASNKNYINYFGEKDIELVFEKYKNQAKDIKKMLNALEGKKHSTIDNILAKIYDFNYFCIEGNAGSGKTVLALQIKETLELQEYKVIFQLINKKFYHQLIKYYKKNENIFWSTTTINDYLSKGDIDFLIIDEAQRLEEKIFENLNNTKLIILGDDRQRIRPDHDFFSIKKFHESQEKSLLFKLEKYRRFSKNVYKWLDYIFTNKVQQSSKKDNNFKIKNFDNIDDFKNYFNESSYKFKCFTTLIQQKYPKIAPFIPIAPKNLNDREFFLQKKELYKNYIFSPYDIISREVDANFIYLPNEFEIEEKDGKLEFHYSLKKDNEDIEFYKNQFWVLLSRSSQEVVFYSENKKTREYLKNKCSNYNDAKIIANKSK